MRLAVGRPVDGRLRVAVAARDAPAVQVMRELAGQYPRYGYRKIRIFLARQGHAMSAERTYRLWRQAGLQVPKRRPRRRVATSRPRPAAADRDQSRVGVRLRVRHVRRRPVAEVPDHRR